MNKGNFRFKKLAGLIITVIMMTLLFAVNVFADSDEGELINLKKCKIAAIPDVPFAGSGVPHEPKIVLTFDGDEIEEECYTLSYKSNTEKGTATVTATGIEDMGFTGSCSKTFKIVKSNSKLKISAIADQNWNGKAIKPAVTVKDGSKTLKKGKDYTLEYSNNINPGPGVVTVTGMGSYKGKSSSASFKIIGNAKDATIIPYNCGWHSGDISPVPTVKFGDKKLLYEPIPKMNKNKIVGDFTCTWQDVKRVGSWTGTVTLKGAYYKGTRTFTFQVLPNISLENAEVKGINTRSGYSYTGKQITPEISSVVVDGKTLQKGEDYSVTYGENINVGTGWLEIRTGMNVVYTDVKRVEFPIKKTQWAIDASDKRVHQSADRHAVDVIKSVDGKKSGYDYQVYYRGNDGKPIYDPGIDVSIQEKNWGGIWVPAYTIGSYTIHVTKAADQNHYKLDRYYNLDIVPKQAPTITGVKNTAQGALEANWKNIQLIRRVKKGKKSYYQTVYEVMYSTRENFTNSSYKRYVGTAQTHSGYNIVQLKNIKDADLLKKGATVYVKVRVGVLNHYADKADGAAWGDWSAVKTIKMSK